MFPIYKKDIKKCFTKVWRKKNKNKKNCGLTLYAKNKENKSYINSIFSKHMTCDKINFEFLTKEKGCNVTFGNNAPTRIRGKGTVVLDENKKGKTKSQNMLYVDGIKNNLLSVSQMCDQEHNFHFHSKGCKVIDANIGKTIVKVVRSLENVYVLEEGKEKCCIGKNDEIWLWHKRIGHLIFNQIVKLGRKYVVRDIPKNSKPENTVCKSCQF
jgi:hypothetical protein